ncbi:MAG: acetyl-CoA carboxylase biotin carboxylase subunit [Clostridiales bacterium]|uniref:Biotin carboxylase n=1 Tax=Candidatus Pullilachnospira stercoravium TaxID=2840913 RepID=A0A9D1T586_9FIRM|nr:acetyl-CoA carboxylase biotin carboxylase subunit [Clostridiales bacterium]HIV11936.1 acetyl-CoA carboxylase biotin carboxylase subunit [Candidatus Pullilachnospira stercoravium]
MFRKILIANRGEIAVRIIRACRELGIKTVAVYSEADREALHTQLADEAVCIGPAAAAQSYLNMESILSACIATKADAIHPGFGFLSENSRFVELCEKCNITFIGPSAAMIDKMGNKSEARKTMMEAGVPVVPGTKEAVYDARRGKELAEQIGYPVMIKASSGGGGKGMRVSESPEDFEENFKVAQLESVRGFADNTMYIEKYVQDPRHIEFQIIADKFGNVVQLGERDCSIQRHHQKVIEESPSVALTPELREEMGAAAVRAAKAVGYESAGTIEFLLDKNKNFYFMEMNTRIQVEHPVTEMVSGVDLIKEMISIAQGNPLSVKQEEIHLQGHAIECRINAEDPEHNFRPCPGVIRQVHLPGGKGVRIDTAVYSGYEIPPYYDSMIAKVIVHGRDRSEAVDKMRSTLGELIIDGVTTNVDFQYEILNNEDFQSGDITTDFIPKHFA